MLTDRKKFYKTKLVNGNKELDYLDTSLHQMSFDERESKNIVITEPLVGRLDLVSDYFYNTPDLWWLIAIANDIINPFEDMFIGQTLFIPPELRFFNFYNENIKRDEISKIFTKRQLTTS